MPTFYSVKTITDKLLDTIESEPTLQNVRVQGEVRRRIGPKSFLLKDRQGRKRLRCFIPFGFEDALIKSGNPVVVEGHVRLFHDDSQYGVEVRHIQAPRGNGPGFNVTKITDRILEIVTGTSELKDIQIQGKISKVTRYVWILRDNDNPDYELKVYIPDAIKVPEEGNVCVRGTINIYPPRSRYEIKVTAIGDSKAPTCQCPGCNKARNPKYELCPRCYKASPDREEKVVEAVKTYFFNLKIKGFSPKTEHGIQMGADNRKADVVLVKDGTDEIFAAIAECKGAGFVGEGKSQLKSYLSATDTRFGVFANRADKEHWKFYENRRRNLFVPITRYQFENGVVKGITHRKQLKDQIGDLERQKHELTREIQQSETFFEALKKDLSDQFKTFLADLKSNLPDSE